jgi:HD-GYP domain-containing protein (c-di-GMP phosphodiesterase class II)
MNQALYLDIELSVSFGWDTKYEDTQSLLDVLRNAEDIMYQKKMLSSTSKRNDIIKSILNTLNLKCPREEAHSKRVSALCESIGRAYNLNTDDIKELSAAGELHDIGKIAIDEVILNKPSGLTEAEWSKIKHHPEIGFRILGATSEFHKIAEYVLEHHEKWDGTGYPKGLKGDEITWKARVISVADSFDAMTCDRPYRKGLNMAAAADELLKYSGIQFDPDIVKVFVEKVLSPGI